MKNMSLAIFTLGIIALGLYAKSIGMTDDSFLYIGAGSAIIFLVTL